MRKLLVPLLVCLGFPGAAWASFSYIPAGQEAESPIIVETAKEAARNAPVVAPKELSLPGPSARERAQAEKLLEEARKAEARAAAQAKKKEEAAARRWAAKEAAEAKNSPRPAEPVQEVAPGSAMSVAPIQQPVSPAPVAAPVIVTAQRPVAVQPQLEPMAAGCPPFSLGRGSLRDQLTRYAEEQGYQVTWNYPNDLIVTNNSTFSSGTFAGNMKKLFDTLQYIGRRDISATLFQGNRALVIESSRR